MRAAAGRPALLHGARSEPLRTVALIGGGHAHVQVLKRWAMDPPPGARLVVVLDRPVAVYSGMVPGFVAGDYRIDELEIDVVPLARRAGACVILAAATDLDPVRQEIALAGRPPIRFDLASLDVGSTVRDLELPGVAEYALSTRPIGRFVAAVDARLEALAARDRSGAPFAPRILVVGGGAAGCELAFCLDARLRRSGVGPHIAIATSERELMSGSSAAVRRRIAALARTRGIESHLGTRIQRVAPDAAYTDTGEPLEADLVVWATGAVPVAFPPRHATEGEAGRADRTDLARDRAGFLLVRDTLQTVGFDAIFAVGDCARLAAHPWVPRAGVYAVRQGPILDRNLRARLAGRALTPYRPQRDFLSLLNVGDGRALAAKWGLAIEGTSAYRWKDRIDRGFMARFQVLESAAARGDRFTMEDAMPCGGCAAKLAAAPLEAALARLDPSPVDASVVVGIEERDDVAVTRSAEGRATLHNIDALRAFSDDAWLVGRVAASNATSDLFAKGGRPRHAQALIGLPDTDPATAEEMLYQALSGVRATLDELGVALVGGHTLSSEVLSVGLSITGDGPEHEAVIRQAGARPGDTLWLTRPLGIGVLLAADMRGEARGAWVAAVQASMLRTHAVGSRLALEAGTHAATDVTGFGLAGHLTNLLRPAGLSARIDRNAIPLLPGARELFLRGLRSTAHAPNRAAFHARVEGASELDEAWLYDPQTAGGLLLAVASAAGPTLAAAFLAAGEPPIACIGRIEASRDRPAVLSIVDSLAEPTATLRPA